MSRGHEHLSQLGREDLPVQLENCAHVGEARIAREDLPVQHGTGAHDGGTPSRVRLQQRLHTRRPSKEEQEDDQRTEARRVPRGPFGGEGRALGTSTEAMQMTAREGVAGRALLCSPLTLPDRERSTPAWLGRAAPSATCAAWRDNRMIGHRGMSTIRSAGTQRLRAMGASPSATSYRHVTTLRERCYLPHRVDLEGRPLGMRRAASGAIIAL